MARNSAAFCMDEGLEIFEEDSDNETVPRDEVRFLAKNRVVIKTKRSKLSSQSSVFKRMLEGNQKSFKIPFSYFGRDPEAFRKMVNHLNGGIIEIEDFQEAMVLFQLAHWYKVPGLGDISLSYMENHKDINYGLMLYQFLKLSGAEDKKITACMDLNAKHAQDIIDSGKYMFASIETLVEFFGHPNLNITSEMVLLEALIQYQDGARQLMNKPWAISKIRLMTIEPNVLRGCKFLVKMFGVQILNDIVDRKLSYNFISHSMVSRKTTFDDISYRRYPTVRQRVKYEKYSVLSTTLRCKQHRHLYLDGLILGTCGQPIAELSMVVTITSPSGDQLYRGSFFLKNLDQTGRKCMFFPGSVKMWGGSTPQNYKLNMIIKEAVHVEGAFCCNELGILTIGDDEDTNSLLMGVVMKSDYRMYAPYCVMKNEEGDVVVVCD